MTKTNKDTFKLDITFLAIRLKTNLQVKVRSLTCNHL
jgi:hypothetical protein